MKLWVLTNKSRSGKAQTGTEYTGVTGYTVNDSKLTMTFLNGTTSEVLGVASVTEVKERNNG